MKKVMEDLNIFRGDFKAIQYIGNEIKNLFILLKMSFKLPFKMLYLIYLKIKKTVLVE